MAKQTAPRIDPPSRPVDGAVADGIRNADPTRHYVLANPSDDYYGVSHMMELGYEVETRRPGGPHFLGVNASAEGTAVVRFGQMLMSCPLELYQARMTEGQSRCDRLEASIRKFGDPDGPFKGPTGRPAYYVGEPDEQVTRS